MITLMKDADILPDIVRDISKVIVMYGTDWCGNCDILKPEFYKKSQEYKGIPFIFVNPDILPKSRDVVDLIDIPSIYAFKDGKEIYHKAGNKLENVQEVLDILLGY